MTEEIDEALRIQRELDAALEDARTLVKGRAVTLPELLGLPQPYEQIPNLYVTRPKIGHKLDLLRKYNAVTSAGFEVHEAAALLAEAFAPLARELAADGSLVPVTGERLLYAFFDDTADLEAFFSYVLNGKKAETAESDSGEAVPNE